MINRSKRPFFLHLQQSQPSESTAMGYPHRALHSPPSPHRRRAHRCSSKTERRGTIALSTKEAKSRSFAAAVPRRNRRGEGVAGSLRWDAADKTSPRLGGQRQASRQMGGISIQQPVFTGGGGRPLSGDSCPCRFLHPPFALPTFSSARRSVQPPSPCRRSSGSPPSPPLCQQTDGQKKSAAAKLPKRFLKG